MSTQLSVSYPPIEKLDRPVPDDILEGLLRKDQKAIPARYLYDHLGSTLFDAITLLPEYGVTRADQRLLRAFAREMVAPLEGPLMVTELGSGSGQKAGWLLREIISRQPSTRYYPIDVSRTALDRSVNELSALCEVRPVEDNFIAGLEQAASQRREGEKLLALFLGSTIGNFNPAEAAEFLREVRERLQSGDAMLLGADLVKPVPRVLEAYNDSIGVTAAFNLNLLEHLNREFGTNFNPRSFRHLVRYKDDEARIEMHLQSLCQQSVEIGSLEIEFRTGETIWTESSHKFSPAGITAMAKGSGFRIQESWTDEEWPFMESLWIAS